MKKREENLVTKIRRTSIAFIVVILCSALAVFLCNYIDEKKLETNLNQISGDNNIVNIASKEVQKSYRELGNEYFKINSETKTISFSENSPEGSFCIMQDEENPTEDDIWMPIKKGEEVQLDDLNAEDITKIRVYYLAGETVNQTTTPTLMARDYKYENYKNTYYAIGAYRTDNSTTYTADKIKTITLLNLNETSAPTTYVATWDASYTEGDATVRAWLATNSGDTTMYDLYLGAYGKIYAPAYSYRLFGKYTNCTSINGMENLDTSKVTSMGCMFDGCSSLPSLDVTHFDTSSVTNMDDMFYGCSSLPSLDVTHFDTSKVTSMGCMFYGCSSLTSLDVTHFDTSAVTNMRRIFDLCISLPSLDVTHFDTSKVTNMDDMFYGCSSLPSLDVTHFDTSAVTNMRYMFYGCSSLTSLDVTHFDTSAVKDMNNMFNGCSSLTSLDVANFDTSAVTSMTCMFSRCSKLESLDVSNFDTSAVTSMGSMFDSCSSLPSLDVTYFDTSAVTSMSGMFFNCSKLESLDLSNFNTSAVTYMSYMFYNCSKLKSLDVLNFNTSAVTSMSGMFENCRKLESLNLSNFNTSAVTDMGCMFSNCSKLESLDLSNFNTSAVTSMSRMFYNCSNLTSLRLGTNFDKLIGANMFSSCSSLKAIIIPRTTIMTLNAESTTSTVLKTLSNAILYVPNATAEATFEADPNYADILGADRIKPILELVGDNPTKITVGSTYTDAGVTVAGMTKNADGTTYTPYGYTVSGPVIKKDGTTVSSVNTSSKGTYTLTYTVHESGETADGMSVTRTVNVVDVPTLMTRDRESSTYYYTIGAYRADNNTTYTADKIKTITLLNLNETSAPTTYVATWDASYTNGDATVRAWLATNSGESTMYDLYLGAYGKIYAPAYSYRLFGEYTNCTSISGMENLDTSKVTNMMDMFRYCRRLPSLDVTHFDTSKVTNMCQMFDSCGSLTSLDVTNFDTSNVTNMMSMFIYCSSLPSLDVTHFDTSKVTNMCQMFDSCSGLTSLDVTHFDTSAVTSMSYMFYNCSKLESLDVSNFNTSAVTSMSGMFFNCSKLESLDLSNFNTSAVTDMRYMFYNCSQLTSLDVTNFDTSKVTYMESMFYNCSKLESLDVTHFNTSAVTNMGYMFYNCSQLESLAVSNFNTSAVTYMNRMFYNCSKLESLDVSNFNTSAVTNMDYMFYNCSNLTSLRLGTNFDKLTGVSMFSGCSNLKAIITPRTTIMTLNAESTTSTGLKTLTNAILYVPTITAETTFEADTNYTDILGADRIRPILELVGDNPTKITVGDTYTDAGVTVAGMSKNTDGTTYTPYGYTVSGPVIKRDETTVSSIDTSSKGTYTLTYTVHESGETADGMSVTRTVNVVDVPTLMVRDYKYEPGKGYTYYAIGAYRTDNSTTYTADKIKTITLLNLNETSAPTTYVATWDASYTNGDGTVTAWLVTNSGESTMYDLYLGAYGKIYAPANSYELFGEYTNCTSISGMENLDTSKVTSMYYMFSSCISLTSLDVTHFDTSQVTNMSGLFGSCNSLTNLDVTHFNTSAVTNMDSMFSSCSSLTSLDVTHFDTSSVTNMASMFAWCINLTNLDVTHFDTSQVISMGWMFQRCNSLTNLDVTHFDTSSVTIMNDMFDWCRNLTNLDVTHFNTSAVTDMSHMFYECDSLPSLDVTHFNTSAVTDMSHMFMACIKLESLNVTNFDTSAVTDMSEMFSHCRSLTSLDVSNFDTSAVTDMGYMFRGCSKLESLNVTNFDTSAVIDMESMFNDCSQLESLDVSNFNTSAVIYMEGMFYNCSNLTSLRLGTNFDKLTGEDMFYRCSNLKAIITPRTTIMTLNDESTTSTGLKTLPNAILYVPTTTAETTFEADPNYADILGADRIRPILELVGKNPMRISKSETYVDSGVTVAGMTKNADSTTYTPYGYTVSGPVIKKDGTVVSSIDTSEKGTYTYTYTIKDSADVEGMSVTRTVNVIQTDINSSNITATIPSETRTYTGSAYTPVVTVKDGSTTLTLNTDYTVSYANNINVGTATITIIGKGKYTGTRIINFTISKASISPIVSMPNYTYGETKSTPSIADNIGNGSVTYYYNTTNSNSNGTDWSTVADSISLNAGTYYMYAVIDATTNYNGATTSTVPFIVNKRDVTIKPKDASKVYDTLALTSNDAEVTAGSLVSGHTATITTSGSITNVGSVTNTISTLTIKNASGSDVTANYNVTTANGTLTVTANGSATFDITLSSTTFEYDGTAKTPTVTVKVGTNILVKETDYEVTYTNNKDAGTATVTITGIGNYTGSAGTMSFTISKRAIEITAGSKTKVYDGTALTSSAFTVTSTTKVASNQTLTVTTNGSITNVGTTANKIATYKIMASSEDVTKNYTVTTVDGTLTITPATVTGSVIITGTNRIGSALTAEITVVPDDVNLTYAWYCGTTDNIDSATIIAGANGSTYSPTTAQLGMYIFVKVEASKSNYADIVFTDMTDNENNKVEKTGEKLLPYLMERELQEITTDGEKSFESKYVIGAYRISNTTTYTADKVKTITLFDLNKTSAPTSYIEKWDASYTLGDETVTAWLVTNSSDNTMYDLYLGAEEKIYAPVDSNRLFASYINCTQIIGLGLLDTTNVANMMLMFENDNSLQSIELSSFNTAKVIDMNWMFTNCNTLTSIDVSSFVTNGVTNMSGMFYGCKGISSLDLTNFNTSAVTNMSQMFSTCEGLENLNVSSFYTSNVQNAKWMFFKCSKLTSLDVTNFDTSNIEDMTSMFAYCTRLVRLDLHTFSTESATSVDSMFIANSSMKTILLGEKFNKLNGSNMFTSCGSLTAIIVQKKITDSSSAMTLSATNTGLNTLTNAVLYVPNLESEGYYELATNYMSVFGEARVRPILEIIGENPTHVKLDEEYIDEGAKVAGFDEESADEYTIYGYTLTVSGLPVDTSTPGTKLVIYTVKYKEQVVVTGR